MKILGEACWIFWGKNLKNFHLKFCSNKNINTCLMFISFSIGITRNGVEISLFIVIVNITLIVRVVLYPSAKSTCQCTFGFQSELLFCCSFPKVLLSNHTHIYTSTSEMLVQQFVKLFWLVAVCVWIL